MEIRLFIAFFILFPLLSWGPRWGHRGFMAFAEQTEPANSQTEVVQNKKQSSDLTRQKSQKSLDSLSDEESSDLSEDSKVQKPKKVVSQKIKEVFQEFITILEKEKIQSLEYGKAVSFLEGSLYSQADFDTLKLLSQVYEQKKDFQNQKNVLKVLTLSKAGAKNPESFYLLAGVYSHLLSEVEESDLRYTEYKEKIFENYKKALKQDQKYRPAYLALLELLKTIDPETQEEKHTQASLSLILDMIKNLKDSKYYILLCRAYYDNRFLKQARRACFRSVKKNPKDPVSPLTLSLSLSDKKKREQKLILTAKEFPQSFLVQYHAGLYFRDHSPSSAILYLSQAHKLQPDHLMLNKILAQVLLENQEFASSYDYYLKACLLSDGAFLPDLRKARGLILRNNKADLVLKFDRAIKQCFKTAREKKREKAKN